MRGRAAGRAEFSVLAFRRCSLRPRLRVDLGNSLLEIRDGLGELVALRAQGVERACGRRRVARLGRVGPASEKPAEKRQVAEDRDFLAGLRRGLLPAGRIGLPERILSVDRFAAPGSADARADSGCAARTACET